MRTEEIGGMVARHFLAGRMACRLAAELLDIPDTRQTFNYDCGAKAVQTVLAYYGVDAREDKLMKQMGTTEEGTAVVEVIRALEGAGLEVEHGKMTVDRLKEAIDQKWPVILPLQAWAEDPMSIDWVTDEEDGHYVIAIGYDGDRIFFEDPSSFRRVYLSEEEFLKRWHDKDEDGIIYCKYGIVAKGKPEYDSSKFVHMD
jgi:predicted double-glycine peptidase